MENERHEWNRDRVTPQISSILRIPNRHVFVVRGRYDRRRRNALLSLEKQIFN